MSGRSTKFFCSNGLQAIGVTCSAVNRKLTSSTVFIADETPREECDLTWPQPRMEGWGVVLLGLLGITAGRRLSFTNMCVCVWGALGPFKNRTISHIGSWIRIWSFTKETDSETWSQWRRGFFPSSSAEPWVAVLKRTVTHFINTHSLIPGDLGSDWG